MTKRKKIMKQKEMARRNSEKLSDLEEAAQERARSLLQRASALRMEQEEELKDMSKVGTSVLPSSEDSRPRPLPPRGGWRRGAVVAAVRGRNGPAAC